MKIAVGTTSKQKFQFLEEVLIELGLDFSVEPIEVASGVSEQPISNKETRLGSQNRAMAALTQSKGADFGLGIEVGYHPLKSGDYRMFCWASLIDTPGNKLSAKSHSLLLPIFHQKILKENKPLGEYVRQFLVENSGQIAQHIGVVIRDRKPFIQTALKLVLLSYLVK